jgi:hypothetical protein
MSLSEKHDAIVKEISGVFEKAGYQVECNKPIGPPDNQQYADIVATGSGGTLIVEIKLGTKTGSSDVMAMESYVRAAGLSTQLRGTKIGGLIISPGTLEPAKSLSKEWNILIIDGNSPEKIKRDLSQFLEKK